MAETEPAVLSIQCLNRRIPNEETLRPEVIAWQTHQNQYNAQYNAKAGWQFRTEGA